MFLYSIQSSAKSPVLDETDAGRSLMNIKNRRVPILILVVLHWLLVVDLTFHHPVKPVEFCLTERILPISRCYLLFHNSPFSSVVCYGALYRMPWRNPIWWGQFGYPYEDFLPAHVRESATVSRSYVWPEIHVDSLLGSYVHQGGSRCLSQLYAWGFYSIYMSVTQVCNCWQVFFSFFKYGDDICLPPIFCSYSITLISVLFFINFCFDCST